MSFIRNLLILLSIFIISCSSVNPNIRSISEGDVHLFLNKAPQAQDHPNAGADFLYSYTYVEYFEDGTSVTRTINRIKIFNERGRNFASQSIPYREGYQKVRIIFANTIKPDGKIIPLDEKDIQDSSEHAGYEFYTDIKVKKFTMPAVENGCIIEYAVEIINLKPVLAFDYADIFLCRNLFPVEQDIIEIVLPANIVLKYKKFKTDITPQITSYGSKRKYTFINTKQDEIIPESRMPSLYDRDTFPQLSFWTLDSWDAVSKWYVTLISEQMKYGKDLETFTKDLIKDKQTDEDKLNAIFNFVSQNIRYIAVLLGPHTYKPHQAEDIFQKRYGDCKDKTTLLLTMLKIAGIEGRPALVPANGKYFDDSIPSLTFFNHIIAVVRLKDKYFWLDATNETASYNAVPFVLPTKVFLINEDGSYRFLTTPPLDDNKDYYSLNMKYDINQEGNADLHYKYEFFGKAAEAVRYSFKYYSPEDRKKFFQDRGIEVNELNLSSFTDTKEPFVINLSGTIKNLAQVLDEETMVLSNIITLDSYRDITAANHRYYPVNIAQSLYSRESSSYKFPAGFKVKKLPQDFIFKQPFRYRSERYDFKESELNIYLETKNEETTMGIGDIVDFKKMATGLQKHESQIKNVIFEKRQQRLDSRKDVDIIK